MLPQSALFAGYNKINILYFFFSYYFPFHADFQCRLVDLFRVMWVEATRSNDSVIS